ncbi:MULTISPECIES: hypothetical protein [unclassified Bradyrhizobium]|uniref:hypothetical protein n=1 Tax=unclassified Bradyrhizobium TaxID=2631580 RepID=UPI001FFA96C5|nr:MULTISPECIES: hypothetical protein [unclassified Bradyrhizobium]MCK1716066.1 hypothetical protein [Bradyrhizobium sp. 143]MCK1730555.1 hypothetical protein [Bradyrhizobium sp. 142]
MADAFDQWIEWIHKPPGDRTGLSSDVHATVMLLPEEDRSDRQKVNAAVWHRAELRRAARTVWIYLNAYDDGERRHVGDPERMKVFASANAADRWFKQHDPEGVAWEYEIEGGPRQEAVWIHVADEVSRAVGDPAWMRLFASKQAAEKWLEQNAPNGKIADYPIEE